MIEDTSFNENLPEHNGGKHFVSEDHVPVTEYGYMPRQPHEIDNISEDVIRLCIATVFNVVDSFSLEKMFPKIDKINIHRDIVIAMMRASGGKINPAVIEKVLREFT